MALHCSDTAYIMPAEVMMGGIGSGAQRSTQVGNVEDTLALDIRALRRLGVVRPGECVCDTVHWSSGGLRIASARLRVDLEDVARGGVATITGHTLDGAICQPIAIEGVPARFGGWRCYFVCPVTAKRSELLYYAGGRFASREGQQLSYAVQGMTQLGRATRRAAKLQSRLHGSSAAPRLRGRNRIEIAERLHEAKLEARALYHARLSAMSEKVSRKRQDRGSAIR